MRQLKKSGVRIELPDRETVLLKRIPLSARGCFNKPRTNLLCKRAGGGSSYLAFVDEDLAYRGGDRELHKAFSMGPTQRGWRVLMLGASRQPDAEQALEHGLAALGFPDGEPRVMVKVGCETPGSSPSDQQGLLDAFAINLSERTAQGPDVEPTIGRVRETEAIVSCLLRWGPARLPVIVAPSGTGKTNILYNAARTLKNVRPDMTVLRVDMVELFSGALFEADRERMLSLLLNEASRRENVLIALEHLQCVLREVPHGQLLLSEALDKGTRITGTMLPNYLPLLKQPPLGRRAQAVALTDLSRVETLDVLERLRGPLEAHHRLQIDPDTLRLCLKKALGLPGHLPAKAILLLDESASNAVLFKTEKVGADDVCAAFSRCRDAQSVMHDNEDG